MVPAGVPALRFRLRWRWAPWLEPRPRRGASCGAACVGRGGRQRGRGAGRATPPRCVRPLPETVGSREQPPYVHYGHCSRRRGRHLGRKGRRACLQPLQPGEDRPLVGRRAGQQHLGAHELEQQPGRGGAAHLVEAGRDDVGRPGQRGQPVPPGLAGQGLDPVRRRVDQAGRDRVGHRGEDDQVAEPVEHVGGEPARLVAALDDPVHRAEHRSPVAGRERVHDLVEQARVGVAEQRDRAVVADPALVRAREQLVEYGQRVSSGPAAGPHHQRQHRRVERDALGGEDLLGQVAHHRRRHQPERVMVGAGPDRRDDLVRLGRREDELQMRRRLLDQLEQGVEPLLGHHVRLVDDVDLVAPGDRGVEGALAKIAGVIDAAVAGRVDLDHVDRAGPRRRQRDARVADAARVRGRPVHAVQRAGEDAGARRLTAAARAAEQVSVVDTATAQRLPQRLGDVILPEDFGEGGGAVLPVQGQALRGPGSFRVFRHDVILAGQVDRFHRNGKGPPAHPSAPAYPCCLPALGGLARCTPHGGSVGKSSHPQHRSRPLAHQRDDGSRSLRGNSR